MDRDKNNGEDNINTIDTTLRIILTKVDNIITVLTQIKKGQDDLTKKIQEIINLQNQQKEIQQAMQHQINNVVEKPPKKIFSNINNKDCDIETIFQIFEAYNKHQGANVRGIALRLSYHFNGEALSTFMSRYETFVNYNEMKTYMINCFGHHSVFSPEDELENLKDTNFKRFGDFLLKFKRLRSKSCNITDKRAIEILIHSISNKEIKKSILMRNSERFDDAFQVAKLASLYEFKETNKLFYSPSY
ncbi:hypothetical protein ACTFIV_005570 [Dictyostelium citrinum]